MSDRNVCPDCGQVHPRGIVQTVQWNLQALVFLTNLYYWLRRRGLVQ